METLDQALRERVDELIGSRNDRQPLLSTTGTQVAIAELIARSDRLERAITELAREVEALGASLSVGGATRPVESASDR